VPTVLKYGNLNLLEPSRPRYGLLSTENYLWTITNVWLYFTLTIQHANLIRG